MKSVVIIGSLIVAIQASGTSKNTSKAKSEKGSNSNGTLKIDDPVLPASPYDASAFWIDYGMILENYPAFSAASVADRKYSAVVRAMTRTMGEYVNSTKDEDVTDGDRQDTILGILDYLVTKETFNNSQVSEDDWKKNNLEISVIKRSSISKLLRARNDLFNSIQDDEGKDRARKQYVRGVKAYRDVLAGLNKEDFSSLIYKDGIDWDLYEKRLMQLLKNIEVDKRFAETTRVYLANWIRDGNDTNAEFDKINEEADQLRKKKRKRNDGNGLNIHYAMLWGPLAILMLSTAYILA